MHHRIAHVPGDVKDDRPHSVHQWDSDRPILNARNHFASIDVYTGTIHQQKRSRMMKSIVVAAALAVAGGVGSGAAAAQTPPAAASDPGNMTRFSRAVNARFDTITRDLVEAADAVPESEYTFKPTPAVRSFGEIVGHVADAQNYFCGVAGGGNPQYSDANEKAAKTPTKASLVAALKASVAKCGEVYTATTATNALELVKAGKGDALRGMMLIDNVSHDNEHYGNIVTYMRLKGHVPPSTARAQKSQ
jgi:uncharacterized damage-inducible protein DinB